MPTISTRTLDEKWREVIRLMYNYKCAKCRRGGHDCHHVVMRADKRHRWHPLNGVLLCHECHADAHSNPKEFKEWLRRTLPDVHDNSLGDGLNPRDTEAVDSLLVGMKLLLFDAIKRRAGHASMTFLPLITFAIIICYLIGHLYFRLTN